MNTASPQDRPRVALIAGPTASGKSALALALAERTGGVIVNADASQVYRDLRILTARPSPEDEARAPHRLFGHIDAAHPHSAAEWAADARAAILTAYNDARPAIIVGGSGLYIRTLLDGIAPVPPIAEDIRSAVRALPITDAFTALAHEDPEAAARLRPSDRTRIARALEVIRSSGRTLASWQRERVDGMGDAIALAPLVLLPPRDWLRARCDARFMAMLAAGAEPEVAALAARDLDPALPAMRAIGVREIMAWQSGVIDRETMLTRVQAATRRYAKRQFTWLAHQLPTEWPIYDAQLGNSESHEYVIKFLHKALTR